MAVKKATRKRSNWYIYLLTFVITFVMLSFVVYNIWEYLFPAKNLPAMTGSSSDNRPDAVFNTTFLLMLSENKGGVPDYYMLMNYRPRDEEIVLIPVKKNLLSTVRGEQGILTDFYISDGSDGVITAIKNAFGVECEHYIKFDKSSFISFFNTAGTTPVNIPSDLRESEIEFLAGSYEFSGEDLYNYITYPEYNQGEDYRLMIHGHAVSNFINKNSRNLTVSEMQSLFTKILNTTDTSLDFLDFTKNQQVYMYTTQNSFNIADYYIPNGTVDEYGQFSVSENTVATIKERFGFKKDDYS